MSLDESGTGAERPAETASYLSEMRDVSDARTLRALTHPVRIALLEALNLGGAMTATQLGEHPLDLSAPSRICAARTPELAERIASALRS